MSHCSSINRRAEYKEIMESKQVNNPHNLHFEVTYWIFYPYNQGKEICFIGKIPTFTIFNACLGKRIFIGDHLGDWEHVSLYFKGNLYPEEMYISVHDAGGYYR